MTVHYIDDNWKLQKRILNFSAIDAPHTAVALSKAILEKLYKWNIDRKLMSIVLDNYSTNDALVRDLLEKLPTNNLVAYGQLFHVRCSAHILNLIVQEGILIVKEVATKVHESVKYVKSSTLRLQTFKEVASQVKAPNKSLVLDVATRWNSTFLMLQTALEFKETFSHLAIVDSSYKHSPNVEEWEHAKIICGCLRYFYDATNKFSVSLYPSANYFFQEICAIHVMLKEFCRSNVPFISSMGNRMMVKFDKY